MRDRAGDRGQWGGRKCNFHCLLSLNLRNLQSEKRPTILLCRLSLPTNSLTSNNREWPFNSYNEVHEVADVLLLCIAELLVIC